MALTLASIYNPVNKFFFNKYKTNAESPIFFRLDKFGSVIAGEEFTDPQEAQETFSDLTNRLPVEDPNGMDIIFGASLIDLEYKRLLSGAIPFANPADPNKEAIIDAFMRIRAEANLEWDKLSIVRGGGIADDYRASFASPADWYDKNNNEIWTKQSFEIKESVSAPPGDPQSQLWKLKLNDAHLQRILPALATAEPSPIELRKDVVRMRPAFARVGTVGTVAVRDHRTKPPLMHAAGAAPPRLMFAARPQLMVHAVGARPQLMAHAVAASPQLMVPAVAASPQVAVGDPQTPVTAGTCPAGGSHDHQGSGDYTLPLGPIADGQANWRWCNKCQGLAFGGSASPGPCPAGGTHDHQGSGDYTLAINSSAAQGQNNWRWCNKCQGLAFGGSASPGPCPAGGTHDHQGSGDYTLAINSSAAQGQNNWRWCNKCQGLVFSSVSQNLRASLHRLELTNRLAVVHYIRENAPTQPSTTTSIKINFEYCCVTIRRPWMMDGLTKNKSWFIPGSAKGQESARKPAGNLSLLPIGFIAIKNLSIEANWSEVDITASKNATDFGPFEVRSEIIDNKLSHEGVQIIGWLLQQMPDLPPNDAPQNH